MHLYVMLDLKSHTISHGTDTVHVVMYTKVKKLNCMHWDVICQCDVCA
jgi:hypothetical protein